MKNNKIDLNADDLNPLLDVLRDFYFFENYVDHLDNPSETDLIVYRKLNDKVYEKPFISNKKNLDKIRKEVIETHGLNKDIYKYIINKYLE